MAFGKRRRRSEADAADPESAVVEPGAADQVDPGESGESGDQHGAEKPSEGEETGQPRDFGPWDSTEVEQEDGVQRMDVGAMRLPLVAGLNLRVDVTQQGTVAGVRLVGEGSEVQLGVFAAPRTAGIWDEVREGVRESLTSQGGTVTDAAGPWGPELKTMMRTPNGVIPGRFVGVDGPRWFLRALILGKAALDSAAAEPYEQVLRDVVVTRGEEARPVREPIPIVLPEEVMAQLQAQMEAQGQTEGQTPQPGPPTAPGQQGTRPAG